MSVSSLSDTQEYSVPPSFLRNVTVCLKRYTHTFSAAICLCVTNCAMPLPITFRLCVAKGSLSALPHQTCSQKKNWIQCPLPLALGRRPLLVLESIRSIVSGWPSIPLSADHGWRQPPRAVGKDSRN
jgi:hypothetical protein